MLGAISMPSTEHSWEKVVVRRFFYDAKLEWTKCHIQRVHFFFFCVLVCETGYEIRGL